MLDYKLFKGDTPAEALAGAVGFLLLNPQPLDIVVSQIVKPNSHQMAQRWWEVTVYYKKD